MSDKCLAKMSGRCLADLMELASFAKLQLAVKAKTHKFISSDLPQSRLLPMTKKNIKEHQKIYKGTLQHNTGQIQKIHVVQAE